MGAVSGERVSPTQRQKAIAKKLLKQYGRSDAGPLFTWGIAELNPEVAKPVPIPKSVRFMYEPSVAERLANVLRKLIGKPVILYGGGGAGWSWAFLRAVELVPYNDGAVAVQTKLEAFPRDPPPPFRTRVSEPFIASWRLAALKGYGDDLVPEAPNGWE